MAQSGYTPIQLYYSSTTTNVPLAGNLSSGELAINITDGKLFYKDNGGVVQTLATKATGTIGGSNTQVQYNSSGSLAGSANFTFNGTTATINTLNLTNPLATAYGGTGLSTFTANRVFYASSTSVIAQSANLTFDGTTLTTTAFQVDNLNLNGNTFSSTDTNGNIVITPNGTGRTTVTNLTTTSPRIVTGINDTNGNELFLFTATASAVNEVTLANAATGNAPTFTSSGSDSNIDLVFSAKGTGQVKETVSGANYALASAYDVGTAPNEIPLNQYLGSMAFTTATNYNTNASPNVISVNSSSNALRITQTGSGNALLVEDSANPDATPFVVTADGNVVIGHTSALAFRAGFIGNVTLAGSPSYSPNSLFNIARFNASAGSAGIEFNKSRSATVGTNTVVLSGDSLGQIYFNGADGTSYIPAATIEVAVDGTPGTNDMPGRLVFSTTRDGASSPTEAMRIDSAQRIGINTTPDLRSLVTIGGTAVSSAGESFSVRSQISIPSSSTTSGRGFQTIISTDAAAFTLSSLDHYYARQGTFGAGSAVTTQYGFRTDPNLTGATNNYGFYSDIASGTGRWNFYAGGTAANHFSGNVLIFGAGGLGYTTGSGGAVTQTTSRTQGVTLDKTNGAITLVSAAGTATWQSFTVTNNTVAATDTIIVNQKSGTDLYMIHVTAVAAGSFRITFATTGGTTTEQPVFNFAVIKASAS
jgi:hypothetical protein